MPDPREACVPPRTMSPVPVIYFSLSIPLSGSENPTFAPASGRATSQVRLGAANRIHLRWLLRFWQTVSRTPYRPINAYFNHSLVFRQAAQTIDW